MAGFEILTAVSTKMADYTALQPGRQPSTLYRIFFVEGQFITILFTNVTVSGFVKVNTKLLKTETLVTCNAIRAMSMNIQVFTSVRLPTQGMTKLPSSKRRCVYFLTYNA
jgi:hypothetical protein